MAGQHIEREARYETTGLTTLQRDEVILKLRRKGWTQTKIARYLGMTQPAVHYALLRLAGKKRRTAPRVDDDEDEWYADVPAASPEDWA